MVSQRQKIFASHWIIVTGVNNGVSADMGQPAVYATMIDPLCFFVGVILPWQSGCIERTWQ